MSQTYGPAATTGKSITKKSKTFSGKGKSSGQIKSELYKIGNQAIDILASSFEEQYQDLKSKYNNFKTKADQKKFAQKIGKFRIFLSIDIIHE